MERYCPWFSEELQQHRCSGGDDDNECDDGRGESRNPNTVWMDVNIPFGYVEDFCRSVFRSDSEARTDSEANTTDDDDTVGSKGIPDYCTANYYKFTRWFAHNRTIKLKGVEVSLCSPMMPWEDCKDRLKLEWKESGRIDDMAKNNAL